MRCHLVGTWAFVSSIHQSFFSDTPHTAVRTFLIHSVTALVFMINLDGCWMLCIYEVCTVRVPCNEAEKMWKYSVGWGKQCSPNGFLNASVLSTSICPPPEHTRQTC